MDRQNGNTHLQPGTKPNIYKGIASRLLAFLLAGSLTAGPIAVLSAQAVTVQDPAASVTVSSTAPAPTSATISSSFIERQDLPTIQSAVSYASLKPAAFKNKPAITLNKNIPKFTSAQLKNRKEYEDFKKGILSSLKKTYSSFTHL